MKFISKIIAAAVLLGASLAHATTYYVDSVTGIDSNGCTAWGAGNACGTVAGALGKSTPTIIYVASEHAEADTTNAQTWTLSTTNSAPTQIICATAGTTTPCSAGTYGKLTTTTAGVTITGYGLIYGFNFSPGTTSSAVSLVLGGGAVSSDLHFINSKVDFSNSTGSSTITTNGSTAGCHVTFENTPMVFKATGSGINMSACAFDWKNTASAVSGSTLPTSIFTVSSVRAANINLQGLDLSATTGNIVGAAAGGPSRIYISNSKVNASATILATPTGSGGPEAYTSAVDSSGTNYVHGKYTYAGSQVPNLSTYLNAGMTNGSTHYSANITTTANPSWSLPFSSLPMAIWNTSTSNITLNVYCAGAALPDNSEIWLEAQYISASGSPQSVFVNNGLSVPLATATAYTDDAQTWTGSPAHHWTMTVTLTTPGQAGIVYGTIKAAEPSTTFYCDELMVLI